MESSKDLRLDTSTRSALKLSRAAILTLSVFVIAFLPRFGIAMQPVPVQINKMLPDDAYYYFLTAENIVATGSPSVDGLNPSNGWHPLWLLVNLPVFLLPAADPDLPVHVMLVIGALLDSLVAVILFRVVRHYLDDAAGLIAGGLYAINSMPIFQSVNGLETALAALMIAVAWTRSMRLIEAPDRRNTILWGLSFGLAFLARTDTAVILVGLGFYVLWRLPGAFRWRWTLLGAGVAAVVIAPWLIWNQVNFGSAFVQVSSVAVPWAAQTRFLEQNPGAALWQLSLNTITSLPPWIRGDYLGAPMLVGFLLWPLALYGLWRGVSDARLRTLALPGVFLLGGGLILVVIYTMLRWYPRPWYFVVNAQALSVGVGLFWYCVTKQRLKMVLMALGLVGAIVAGLFAWQVGYYPWQRDRMYAAALWLRDNTPADTVAASMNSGIIGYYSGRTTINLDGVVNPNAFAASQQQALMAYMRTAGASYFLDFDHAVQDEYGPFMGPDFQRYLTEVTQIGDPYPGLGSYRVYKLPSP